MENQKIITLEEAKQIAEERIEILNHERQYYNQLREKEIEQIYASMTRNQERLTEEAVKRVVNYYLAKAQSPQMSNEGLTKLTFNAILESIEMFWIDREYKEKNKKKSSSGSTPRTKIKL